jgi:hypothetical protein
MANANHLRPWRKNAWGNAPGYGEARRVRGNSKDCKRPSPGSVLRTSPPADR